MSSYTQTIPQTIINEINAQYPSLWRRIEGVRPLAMKHFLNRKGRPWGKWCYLPDLYFHEAVRIIDGQIDSATLWAVTTWRLTKGIYRFDPDIYKELIDTPITGQIPGSLLLRLPEWSVYIETPGFVCSSGLEAEGFLVTLSDGVDSNLGPLIHITGLGKLNGDIQQIHAALPILEGKTIEECLEEYVDFNNFTEEVKRGGLTEEACRLTLDFYKMLIPTISKVLSLVLYICQEVSEGDLRPSEEAARVPENPAAKKTRHGTKVFAATKPTIWECGMRQGPDLRRAWQAYSESHGGTHSSPRPHSRRAHWHTYHYGKGAKKDPSKRTSDAKWIHALLVNVRYGDTVQTVREVKTTVNVKRREDIQPTIRTV